MPATNQTNEHTQALDNHADLITSSAKGQESSSQLLALCLLLVLWGTGFVACQKPSPQEAKENKEASASSVLVLTPQFAAGQKATPEAMKQAKLLLEQRLQDATLSGDGVSVSISKEGGSLQVNLPKLSLAQVQKVKAQLMRQQSALAVAPMLRDSVLLAKAKHAATNDPKAKSLGVSVQPVSWKGPDGKEHRSFSLQHKERQTLKVYAKSLLPALGSNKAQWVFHKEEGHWSAFLINRLQELRFASFRSVKTVPQTDTHRIIKIQLHEKDGAAFHALTKGQVGNRLVIRTASRMISSPVLMTAIRGSALQLSIQASGDTHPLVRLLGINALPIEFKLKSQIN